jgi:hypothetical protein
MNYRSIRTIVILGALSAAPAAVAQTEPPESQPKLSALLLEPNSSDSSSTSLIGSVVRAPIKPGNTFLSNLSKKRFVLLSAGVYGAALADMHQTLAVRENSWWYETNPLAKPLVRLPAPAYYATGLAMATGINWLSWKMARSRRWRKLAPIPQLLAVSGNLYGFRTNRY